MDSIVQKEWSVEPSKRLVVVLLELMNFLEKTEHRSYRKKA